MSINTKPEDFKTHYNLIKKYKSIFISYGQHPEYVDNKNIISSKEIITMSNNNDRVVGIGETGIDLFHSTNNFKFQIKSFENHIEASIDTKIPLIIHQRNSENEIIDILSNYKNNSLSLVMHCLQDLKNLEIFVLIQIFIFRCQV